MVGAEKPSSGPGAYENLQRNDRKRLLLCMMGLVAAVLDRYGLLILHGFQQKKEDFILQRKAIISVLYQKGFVLCFPAVQDGASYEAERAAKEVSAMSLFQAYESYQWEVKGRINASI